MDNDYFEQEETECTCGHSRDGICHCSTLHQLPTYDDVDDTYEFNNDYNIDD